jgi:uncharacterized membrane protein
LFLVGGQLFFKHAMNPKSSQPRSAMVRNIFLGIVLQSIWFFLWLGLLQRYALSRIFPFEGLNPAMLVLCAWIFLKERLPAGAWVGLGMICVGLAVVAGS